jgi:hypothetical protein
MVVIRKGRLVQKKHQKTDDSVNWIMYIWTNN